MRVDDANPAAACWLAGDIDTTEFIAILRTPVWVWARRAARRNNLPASEYEDCCQSAMTAVVAAVRRYDTSPSTRDTVGNWSATLRQVATREAYRYIAGCRQRGLSGLSAATRRNARITKARRELAARIGREPTDREVIDHVNMQVSASVRNPVKAGARVSTDDLHRHAVITGDETAIAVIPGETGDMTASDTAITLNAAITACQDIDPVTGAVAACWLADVLTTGRVATIREIRQTCGVTARQAREHINLVRTVVARHFGRA